LRRWLALTLGAAATAAALYALATWAPDRSARDEIDAGSRARLDAVLRESDRQEEGR
jgi:hypothetical protein